MRAFLLTWNPANFPGLANDWPQMRQEVASDGRSEDRWSTRNQQINPGDRVYLLRQGIEPRGIVAAGHATSEVYLDAHWNGEDAETTYVDVEWEALTDLEDPLPIDVLQAEVSGVHWRPQSSGNEVTAHDEAIATLWREHINGTHQGRAWLAISVDERARAVNDGYDDDPARHYSWDSTVAHSRDLRVGDAIVLWDKQVLLGASRIERITTGTATKAVYRCRECSGSNIKPRKTRTPTYRCEDCFAEFDAPRSLQQSVTTYRTDHAREWVDLAGALSGAELRMLCEKPRSQLSLRLLRWDDFLAALREAGYGTPLTGDRSSSVIAPGGHTRREVMVRQGQAAFRRQLLDRFGSVCAFSGPCPEVALEAAHLYSYASEAKHWQDGGFLLRRDLHRLFDLGHIAINPETATLDLTGDIREYAPYRRLHGAKLATPLTRWQKTWVSLHWNAHR